MKQQPKAPHSATIWDEAETWSRDHIESFQLDALRRQLARVQQTSVYYQRVFTEAGFEPGAVVDAVMAGDLRGIAKAHTGMSSVQLQAPGAKAAASTMPPPVMPGALA